MTSKRTAVLVDAVLSRLGVAVLVFVLLGVSLAFTVGMFPRTILGTLILIAIGVPFCVLGGLSFTDWSRSISVRVAAFLGFVALLALLWWLSASHASFMRQNFF